MGKNVEIINNNLLNFQVGVDTMRILSRLFAFACKQGEDGFFTLGSLLASDSGVDFVFPEAANGMMFQISRGRFVLGVLKASNTTCFDLALGSSTFKEMAGTTIVIL